MAGLRVKNYQSRRQSYCAQRRGYPCRARLVIKFAPNLKQYQSSFFCRFMHICPCVSARSPWKSSNLSVSCARMSGHSKISLLPPERFNALNLPSSCKMNTVCNYYLRNLCIKTCRLIGQSNVWYLHAHRHVWASPLSTMHWFSIMKVYKNHFDNVKLLIEVTLWYLAECMRFSVHSFRKFFLPATPGGSTAKILVGSAALAETLRRRLRADRLGAIRWHDPLLGSRRAVSCTWSCFFMLSSKLALSLRMP